MSDSKKEKISLAEGIRSLWFFLQPYRTQITIVSIFGVISAAANGAVPYVTGRFFDSLISLSHETPVSTGMATWGFLLAVWALIQIVAHIVDWVIGRRQRDLRSRIQFGIQARGFEQFFQLPVAYHKRERMSEVTQRVDAASWRVPNIMNSVVTVGPQLLSVVIGALLVFSINSLLAWILVTGVVVYCMILVWIVRSVAVRDADVHRVWNQSWGDADSAVKQIESVKQAAAEGHEIEKMRTNLLGKAFTLWRSVENTWTDVGGFQGVVVFLTQLSVFLVSIRLIADGAITVGDLVAINGYSMMFFAPFVTLGYNWESIQNGISSAQLAVGVFREPIEKYTPEGGHDLPDAHGDVVFDHVSFAYDAEQGEILHDLSFTVRQGEVVALVGESGVGKSTIASLISAYYFPTSGSVMIGGIDTRELNLHSLRMHIGVVPQEIALFNDTLRENIRYGTFNASQEQIAAAVREAQLEEFIASLPAGYDTVVGERGLKLSVGQKQRVALARAIVRAPSILILDEPTAALDAKTEHGITKAIEQLMRGRTTFIIAHRLSTIRSADRILVFDKGRLAEMGTHAELVKLESGIYRGLRDYQIGASAI